jgi:hypothetical protein
MRHFLLACILFSLSCSCLKAQGTAADYERANGLNNLYQ